MSSPPSDPVFNPRAGTLPEPALESRPLAGMCPEFIAGYCRQRSCRRGSHSFAHINEVEHEQAEQTVPATPKSHRLRRVCRNVGLGYCDYDSDGPGQNSAAGPRHDNDFAEVHRVQILPTTDEILCLRLPYLPKKDTAFQQDWSDVGTRLHDHCEAQFRHLRFELTEPIIDAVYNGLQIHVLNRLAFERLEYTGRFRTTKGVGFNLFRGVELDTWNFTEQYGLQLRLSFNCPNYLRNNGMRDSNILEPGMLSAIIAVNLESGELFTVFLETISRHSTWSMRHKTGNDTKASVFVKLAETQGVGKMRELLYILKPIGAKFAVALIDLTGILLQGTVHHLKRLQTLSREAPGKVPFLQTLMAPKALGNGKLILDSPNYSRKEGFQWSLDGLKIHSHDTEPFVLNTEHPLIALADLDARTSLDVGQAKALFANLTSELAFTQGPPGTGKSFLGISTMKVMVDSLPLAARGPIILIAQTNHALDETLEGLLDKGVTSIARLGSRSKSAKLKPYTLTSLRRKRKEDREECGKRLDARQKALALEKDGAHACDLIGSTDVMLSDLAALNINDHGGDQEELVNNADVSDENSDSPDDSRSTQADRRRSDEQARKSALAKLFGNKTLAEKLQYLIEINRRYQLAQEQVTEARQLKNYNILKETDIVAMTTTACAREIKLIKKLNSRILIIEEASEVLEAHSLCALMPTIQHMVNIGDPLQLRPQANARELNTEYDSRYRLNEPLFERLIKAGLPYAKLSVQRRAHPELARLIQVTDYPDVTNHDSTLGRAPVPSMSSRLQWVHHTCPETLATPRGTLLTESWANEYEAAMCCALAKRFIKHAGYGHEDIVILTPYNGQLIAIAEKLAASGVKVEVTGDDKQALLDSGRLSREDLGMDTANGDAEVNLSDMIRVATIDNFQGEEARIVIFSAVRSNQNGKIGFLSISNRINVAVSRAKEGFYVIGNAELLSNNSDHWKKIIDQFREQGAIHDRGFSIPSQLQPGTNIVVKRRMAENSESWEDPNDGCDDDSDPWEQLGLESYSSKII